MPRFHRIDSLFDSSFEVKDMDARRKNNPTCQVGSKDVVGPVLTHVISCGARASQESPKALRPRVDPEKVQDPCVWEAARASGGHANSGTRRPGFYSLFCHLLDVQS